MIHRSASRNLSEQRVACSKPSFHPIILRVQLWHSPWPSVNASVSEAALMFLLCRYFKEVFVSCHHSYWFFFLQAFLLLFSFVAISLGNKCWHYIYLTDDYCPMFYDNGRNPWQEQDQAFTIFRFTSCAHPTSIISNIILLLPILVLIGGWDGLLLTFLLTLCGCDLSVAWLSWRLHWSHLRTIYMKYY